MFPVLPRTGQVIDPASSSFSSISFHHSQPEENLKKIEKVRQRYDRLARIAGNTQQSSPMFIKLINKNLSKDRTIDEQTHAARLYSNNSNGSQLNKPNWLHSNVLENQLKSNINDGIDAKNEIWKFKKPETMEASCISNNKKQKHVIFKEYFRFWNFSLEPIDLNQHSLHILHISMINRKCSTDQKSAFCCQEITKSVDDFTNKNTNVCNVPQESKKCHEFCININPENGHFINSMEYPCLESGGKSSISTFVDWVQTIIYNKTSAIIVGQNENARNPEFQTWAKQMLQNLDIALALNNYNSTTIFSEEQTSNTVLLSQWIEFPKSNETTTGQEIAWQLLKEYQQYDENVSNNLIRICTTNQEMVQIICTEQHFHNFCRLDDPDECVDDIFSAQRSVICRHFIIDGEKVMEITELLCDSLNESVIFWDYQREASESATGILMLQLTRTTVIHSIPVAAVQLNQHGKSESIKEKRGKYGSAVKLKTDGQAKNTYEKILKTPFPELSKMTENLAEFRKIHNKLGTVDSLIMQKSDQTYETDLTVSENLSEVDVTTSETALTITSNLTNPPEIKQNFDDIFNSTTANITNSNHMNKINTTVEIQVHTINDSAGKAVTTNHKTNLLKRNKQPLWKPFHMDCNIEKDEFNVTNCSNWAAAGYCLSNNATRFLWCRKTCLCVGPPQL
ncbi:unnamed protein product [Cercopithifilaria johnstoni]|uniref:ShKT domain-containing protein n=1 Tax=Cercopithifilaria johnstoni TaxID=2874296 RepID=A0A8J2LWN2_9BILA|nr:unnamed protein product [Cercopithifilaria johnstoni]